MSEMILRLNESGDGAIPEMLGAKLHHADTIYVAALEGGMTSGRGSVSLAIPLADGSFVFAQTSVRLFLAIAAGLAARFDEDGRPKPTSPTVLTCPHCSTVLYGPGLDHVANVKAIDCGPEHVVTWTDGAMAVVGPGGEVAFDPPAVAVTAALMPDIEEPTHGD